MAAPAAAVLEGRGTPLATQRGPRRGAAAHRTGTSPMGRAPLDAGERGWCGAALDPGARRIPKLDRRVPCVALCAGTQNLGTDLSGSLGTACRRDRGVVGALKAQGPLTR